MYSMGKYETMIFRTAKRKLNKICNKFLRFSKIALLKILMQKFNMS